jgi:hypothetical protein
MGWSPTRGFRPNRPRPLRVPGVAVPVKRALRRQTVGVLTQTATGVRRVYVGTPRKLRYERHVWTQQHRLHPTKGYRIASPITKTVETTTNSRLPKGWRLGLHETKTFTRSRGGAHETGQNVPIAA